MSQFNFSNQTPSTGRSNVASDKLRKAIERNRLRQAKRDGKASAKTASKSTLRSAQNPKPNNRQQEFFFNSNSTPRSTMPKSSSAQRVSVATPNSETQFVRPLQTRKTTKKSSIKYPVKKTSTTKRKRAKANKARNEWLMKGSWVVLALIFVRLIFAERGILDYFSMKDLITHKLSLIEQTKQQNKDIKTEMDLIRNNSRYQKQIVREKLGFISKDEYLVIFSGESARKSN